MTLDDLKKLQLLQDKNFAWTIGRVDDRLYETNFPDIMMESEILAELQSKPLPDNVHAAFLKTCYNFADKMGLSERILEHRFYELTHVSNARHSITWLDRRSVRILRLIRTVRLFRFGHTRLRRGQVFRLSGKAGDSQ